VAPKWTPEEIAEGRRNEEQRREIYYSGLDRKRMGRMQKFWRWTKGFFLR